MTLVSWRDYFKLLAPLGAPPFSSDAPHIFLSSFAPKFWQNVYFVASSPCRLSNRSFFIYSTQFCFATDTCLLRGSLPVPFFFFYFCGRSHLKSCCYQLFKYSKMNSSYEDPPFFPHPTHGHESFCPLLRGIGAFYAY